MVTILRLVMVNGETENSPNICLQTLHINHLEYRSKSDEVKTIILLILLSGWDFVHTITNLRIT